MQRPATTPQASHAPNPAAATAARQIAPRANVIAPPALPPIASPKQEAAAQTIAKQNHAPQSLPPSSLAGFSKTPLYGTLNDDVPSPSPSATTLPTVSSVKTEAIDRSPYTALAGG